MVFKMANEDGYKIKLKRSHGSKPYERRKSFLSRIKDAAYGLKDSAYDFLMPSWLSETINNSVKTVENKVNEDVVENQCLTSPSLSHNLGHSYHQDTPRPLSYPVLEANNDNNRIIPPSTSYQSLSSDLTRDSHIRQTSDLVHSLDKKDTIGDDHSECSESTSGCSSMLPHPVKRDYQKDLLQESDGLQNKVIKNLNHSQQHTDDTSSDTKHSQRHYRGLWSIEEDPILSKPQPSARDSTHSFNVSAFGTSVMSENPSVFGESTLESPFYPGKTRYGGALNHRKSRLQLTSPYHRITPVRQKVKVKSAQTSDSDEFGMISNTARRILEVLEKMSTPISDAKKIPISSFQDNPLSFQVVEQRSLVNNNRKRGPPVNNICTPSKAVISRNFQSATPKISALTNSDKSIENRSKPEENNLKTQFFELPKSTGGGKMKSGRLKENLHYSRNPTVVEEKEYISISDLPQISLSVTNLPQFNFEIPTTTSQLSSKPDTSLPVFEFSIPIAADNPSNSITDSISTAAFTFSSPLSLQENRPINSSSSTSANVNFEYRPSSLKLKTISETKELNTKEDNKRDAAFRPADEIKSGSVSDILSQGWGDRFKPPPGSWECSVCCVNNKAELDSCQACQTPKPEAKANKIKLVEPNKNDTQSLNCWECNKCSTKNISNTCCKCSACKPILVLNANFDNLEASKGFADKFKPTPGSWECSDCLVRNTAEALKCIACDLFKPGISIPVTIARKTVADSKNIELQDLWKCDICFVTNKADAAKCMACQTLKQQNSYRPEKDDFKFNFKDSVSTTTTDGTTTGFVFGNATVTTSSSAFTFGNSNANNVNVENNLLTGSVFTSKTDSPPTGKNTFIFGKTGENMSTSNFQFGTPTITTNSSSFIFNKPCIADAPVIDTCISQEIKLPSEVNKTNTEFSFDQTKSDKIISDNQNDGFKFSVPSSVSPSISSTETKPSSSFTFGKYETVVNSNTSTKSTENFKFCQSSTCLTSSSDKQIEGNVGPVKTDSTEIKQSDASGANSMLTSFEVNSNINNKNSEPTNVVPTSFQFSFSKEQPQDTNQKFVNDSLYENKIPATTTTVSFSFGNTFPTATTAPSFSLTSSTTTTTPSNQTPMFAFPSAGNPFSGTMTTVANNALSNPTFSFGTPTEVTATSTTTLPSATTTNAASLNTPSTAFSFKSITTTSSNDSCTNNSFSFPPSSSGFSIPTFTTTTASLTPAFTFTASTATPNFGITAGGPVFGKSSASSIPPFGSSINTPVTSTPTFRFGNPATTAASMFGSVAANVVTTAASVFGRVTPTFGTSSSAPSGTSFSTGPIVFGTGTSATNTTPFGTLSSAPTTIGFPPASTSSFAFGSQPSQSTTFAFSGNQSTSSSVTGPQSQSIGFNFSNSSSFSSTPNFNFGSQPSSGPFHFSATSNPQTNPFSIPSGPSSSTRKFKKAVRKIRK